MKLVHILRMDQQQHSRWNELEISKLERCKDIAKYMNMIISVSTQKELQGIATIKYNKLTLSKKDIVKLMNEGSNGKLHLSRMPKLNGRKWLNLISTNKPNGREGIL